MILQLENLGGLLTQWVLSLLPSEILNLLGRSPSPGPNFKERLQMGSLFLLENLGVIIVGQVCPTYRLSITHFLYTTTPFLTKFNIAQIVLQQRFTKVIRADSNMPHNDKYFYKILLFVKNFS